MTRGVKGTRKTYNCLHCNKENLWGHSKINKFCNNVCQGHFKWFNVTIDRIEKGEVPDGAPALKKYLLEKFGEKCIECGQEGTWNNKPLVLQLDHIDGNSDNNFPSNLRLLCPNCHTQTETFGNGGQGTRYKKNTKRNNYLREYRRLGA